MMHECYKQLDRICQDVYEELPKFLKKHKKFYQKYDPCTELTLKLIDGNSVLHIEHDRIIIQNGYNSGLTIEFYNNCNTEYSLPEYDSISYAYKTQYELILRENDGSNDNIDEDIVAVYNPDSRMITSDWLHSSKEITSLDCCKELMFQMSLDYDNLVDPEELWTTISSYRKLDTLGIVFRLEINQELSSVPDLKTVLVMP